MKRLHSILLTVVCCLAAMTVTAQEHTGWLERQRKMFPQEKVYVMTDRDLYLSGDTARMRAWIYDCNSRKPQSVSKYVYVELRDAADNLKVRRKLLNKDGLIRGYLALPSDLTSGDYTLAAYTYYMTGTTGEMFFRKRLHVMNPRDISRGLLPANIASPTPSNSTVIGREATLALQERGRTPSPFGEGWGEAVALAGSNVAVSITADRLCRADSTSSITWSLATQPDLFTEQDMAGTGELYSPTTPYEAGQIISGTVYGNISTKKPQAGIKVSMVIPSRQYTDACITDANGRFTFKGFDLPDSTLVFISARKGKHTRMENIVMDGDSLPEHISVLPAIPHYFRRTDNVSSEMKIISNTIDLANTQMLDEITVKGKKREKITETYQNFAASTLVADELLDKGVHDLESAIRHIPGVRYKDGVLCYQDKPLRFFIDGIEEDYDPEDDAGMPSTSSMVALSYPLEVVQRIDLLRPADTAFLGGAAGGGGMAAICITLKDGAELKKHSRSASLKFVWPLGYQRYKKFHAPSADAAWPVIYWNPDITIKDDQHIYALVRKVMKDRRDNGDKGIYTVHIDGFTADGEPIHVEKQITD